MKHSKRLVFLFSMLLLGMLLAPNLLQVKADENFFEITPITGYWEDTNPSNVTASGDNSGYLPLQYGEAITNGFILNCTINDFGANVPFFGYSGEKEVTVTLTLVKLFDITISYNFTLKAYKDWFGQNQQVYINGSQGFKSHPLNSFPNYVLLGLQKGATNDTVIVTFGFYDKGTSINGETGVFFYFEDNYTLSSDLWNSELLCFLEVQHKGNGFFNLTFSRTTAFPDGVDGYQFISETIGPGLGFLQDIIDFLSGGWQFIIGIVTVVIAMMLQVTPYLPFIGLLYVIDLGIESYRQGSIQPMGRAFRELFNIIVQAYDAMVNLGQLVWDAITFWT